MADPDALLGRTIARLNEISLSQSGEPPHWGIFTLADIKEIVERLSQLEDERKDQVTEEGDAVPDATDTHPNCGNVTPIIGQAESWPNKVSPRVSVKEALDLERRAAEQYIESDNAYAAMAYKSARITTDAAITYLDPELLTVDEHEAIVMAGQLWSLLTMKVVPPGPTQEEDRTELRVHIHAIQQAIMSQAAARAYPGRLRGLGGTHA